MMDSLAQIGVPVERGSIQHLLLDSGMSPNWINEPSGNEYKLNQ